MTENYETWLPVPSLNGHLEVSNHGRVRRIAREMVYSDGRKGTLQAGLLKGSVSVEGYHTCSYGNKKLLTHRLIAEAFLPPLPGESFAYHTVNHKNGVKLDNRPENLEWASYQANNIHARDTGLNKQHGQNTNLSKFSEQLVASMLRVHSEYSPPTEKLAELFGMSPTTIRDILTGRSRVRG